MQIPRSIKLLLPLYIAAFCLLSVHSYAQSAEAIAKEYILFSMPKLIDSTPIQISSKNTAGIRTASYQPLYIGNYKNTINISHRIRLNNFLISSSSPIAYLHPDTSSILIYIDTTQKITTEVLFNLHTILGAEAYPVCLLNRSKDSLNVGYGSHIPIIMEALFPDGEWNNIEVPFLYNCGVGLRNIALPPDNMLICALPLFKGNYNTLLRFRYHDIVSATFKGQINITKTNTH